MKAPQSEPEPRRRLVDPVELDLRETVRELELALATAGPQFGRRRRLRPGSGYGAADVSRIRELAGMSRTEFAELLAVDAKMIADWESGAAEPTSASQHLLEILDPDKPESRILQMRRAMMGTPDDAA